MAKLSSFAQSFEDLCATAQDFGSKAGAGDDSILGLGLRIYASTKYATLQAGDVEQVYRAFADGRNANEFGRKAATDGDSFANAVSKMRRFHALGSHGDKGADMWSVVVHAVKAGRELDASAKTRVGGSLYEKVLTVIRAQTKKGGPAKPMSLAQVREVLAPKPAKDRDVVERLTAILNAAKREFAEGSVLSPIEQAPFVNVAAFVEAEIARFKATQVSEAERLGVVDTSDVEFDPSELEGSVFDDAMAA